MMSPILNHSLLLHDAEIDEEPMRNLDHLRKQNEKEKSHTKV